MQILNKAGTASVDIKSATFKNNNLTLNVTGGGKVILSGVESSTSINVNGTSQTVSELVS